MIKYNLDPSSYTSLKNIHLVNQEFLSLALDQTPGESEGRDTSSGSGERHIHVDPTGSHNSVWRCCGIGISGKLK